jgi:phosphomannomutase
MTTATQPPGFRPLKFGTSGLRDFDENLTDLEVFINTRGFLDYLLELGAKPLPGGIQPGSKVAMAVDYRPSSRPDKIPRAVAAAILDAGCVVTYCGPLPTPAVTNLGIRRGIASIMVTGSHIPFGQNGIKFNRPDGEILKAEEAAILAHVAEVRAKLADQQTREPLFDSKGAFIPVKSLGVSRMTLLSHAAESLRNSDARAASEFVSRYIQTFGSEALLGLELVFFKQSTVGRDILPAIFRGLGAVVSEVCALNVEAGEFLPVDTEKMEESIRARLRTLAREHFERTGRKPFAVLSADGDSDRPVFCDENGEFIPGDQLGVLASLYLKPTFVALPITCNSAAVEILQSFAIVVQTRVGSPFINKAMRDELAAHPQARVAGYEANGGYLLGSDWLIEGKTLKALPTRDSVLPMICALLLARRGTVTTAPNKTLRVEKVSDLTGLIHRYTAAGVVDSHDGVPYASAETGKRIVAALSPQSGAVVEIDFQRETILQNPADAGGRGNPAAQILNPALFEELELIRKKMSQYFLPGMGYSDIVKVNYLDGVRIYFADGDIVHLRPSGNAAEFRFYTEAASASRAQAMCGQRVEIVRRMIESL